MLTWMFHWRKRSRIIPTGQEETMIRAARYNDTDQPAEMTADQNLCSSHTQKVIFLMTGPTGC